MNWTLLLSFSRVSCLGLPCWRKEREKELKIDLKMHCWKMPLSRGERMRHYISKLPEKVHDIVNGTQSVLVNQFMSLKTKPYSLFPLNHVNKEAGFSQEWVPPDSANFSRMNYLRQVISNLWLMPPDRQFQGSMPMGKIFADCVLPHVFLCCPWIRSWTGKEGKFGYQGRRVGIGGRFFNTSYQKLH